MIHLSLTEQLRKIEVATTRPDECISVYPVINSLNSLSTNATLCVRTVYHEGTRRGCEVQGNMTLNDDIALLTPTYLYPGTKLHTT